MRYAPVRDLAEVAADPQVWANGYLRVIEDDDGADVLVVGSPIAFSADQVQVGGIGARARPAHRGGARSSWATPADEIGSLRDAGAC